MKILSAMRLNLSCAAAVVSATAFAAAAPATGSGYLEAAQRQYTPQGCTQNGNTAQCTFAVVNHGNPLNLRAWPGDLRTLQLVDSSHVPHGTNRAYFVDSSGNHQTQLVLQSGDQGSIVVEFPNANVNATTAEFHLHSQIVGGAASPAAAASGTSATPAAAAPAAAAAKDKASGAKSATPAGATGTTPPAAPPAADAKSAVQPSASTQPAACASNAKSAACKAAEQEERVCAKNPSSAACKQATARAQKLDIANK